MTTPAALNGRAVDLLFEVSRALDVALEDALSVAGPTFTVAQLRALRVLGAGPRNVVGLAAEVGSHRSSASRIAARLAAAGLVRREPSPVSRREVMLTLTPSGRRLLGRVAGARRAALARILDEVPDDQKAEVEHALEVLAATVGEVHGAPGPVHGA